MKRIARDSPQYSLDSRHEPVAAVSLGDSFLVETHDCRTGTITREDQVEELRDTRFVNPATGPIMVHGVSAGDTICIRIEAVTVNQGLGLMVTRPGTTGLNLTSEPQLRIINVTERLADAGSFQVELSPMVGLIGVAPPAEPVSTFFGGEHGGNMDTRLIGTGSSVYLPAYFDGGLLYFGDMHAAMGDGEVFLSGVEVAGLIQASVHRAGDWSLRTPLVETEDTLAVLGCGKNLDEAANSALAKAGDILMAGGLAGVDAGYLMSVAGHLRISQYLPGAGVIHCRFELPKAVLSLNHITLRGLVPMTDSSDSTLS
jgi:amidase